MALVWVSPLTASRAFFYRYVKLFARSPFTLKLILVIVFFSILSISYLLYLILLYFTNRNGVARCKKMGVFPLKRTFRSLRGR